MIKGNFKALLFLMPAVIVLLASGNGEARLRAFQSNGQHDQQDAQAGDKWAEMEAFHEVMSHTFHPAEEGKLDPIRKRAGEMEMKAKQWLESKPPKVYDTPDIKALLGKLSVESKALAETVARKGSDEQVKKELTALHDRFHEIIGACQKKKH